MIIKKERREDYREIYDLVREAFLMAPHRDGNEEDLVASLRKGEAYIPDLSLVAEEKGDLLGFIMFTKAYLGETPVLALAPLAVLPSFQGQGLGLSLINEGHRRARDLGFSYSLVLGDDRYYSKAGYLPAKEFGIEAPFAVPENNFMAKRLDDEAPMVEGVLKYAEEFGIN